MDIIIPEILEMNTASYKIKVRAIPGKPLPSLNDIKGYLDTIFEPHVGFEVSNAGKDC